MAAGYARLRSSPDGYGRSDRLRALALASAYRQGHDCVVVAPSLIPKRPGDRVKSNRRDAVSLARLHRAGELTAVWVPDRGHEAMRDLVRAREAAQEAQKRARQQLQSFLLGHGRIYSGRSSWSLAHMRWISTLKFEHPAHFIDAQGTLPGDRGCRGALEASDRSNLGDRQVLDDGSCRRSAG